MLQTLIIGLAQGASYALIALGYTMVYGVLGMINFAHGEVFTLGAYAGILALAGGTALGGYHFRVAGLGDLPDGFDLSALDQDVGEPVQARGRIDHPPALDEDARRFHPEGILRAAGGNSRQDSG